MLSLFNSSASKKEDDEANSFNVMSFVGMSSNSTANKKTATPSNDKKEKHLNITRDPKQVKDLKPPLSAKTQDKDRKIDSSSRDKPSQGSSRDLSKPSQPNQRENHDKSKDQKRDPSREDRGDKNNHRRENLPSRPNGNNSSEVIIKKKINVHSDSDSDSPPRIKKAVPSSTKPQVPSTMNKSNKPESRGIPQQSSSKPQVSNNRSGPVTAQAKGRTFNPSLDKFKDSVVLGQSSKSGSSSASKPGSTSMKPPGAQSNGIKSSHSSSKPVQGQLSRPSSGKPTSMNSSQARPSSGNSFAKPLNKPGSSNMNSRPTSQQPIKKPNPNGAAGKPSSDRPVPSKPKPSKPAPVNTAPTVRYINGKPVPIKGAETQDKNAKPADAKGGSNLGKRPGDNLPNSRYEPGVGKKHPSLNNVFRGKPHRPGNRRYDDEDDYDDDDSFIDDGSVGSDDPNAELEKMFKGYRQKVQKRRHLEDDVSDMEAGFDVIEKEEEYSKLVGDEEDRRQLEFIKREMEDERKKEMMKRKKLQLD